MLKKGVFYLINDAGSDFVLEDRTKRGLAVKERSVDKEHGVMADKGVIHDMDGVGHQVAIRWLFPKDKFDLKSVLQHAEAMEAKYTKMRELTCPD